MEQLANGKQESVLDAVSQSYVLRNVYLDEHARVMARSSGLLPKGFPTIYDFLSEIRYQVRRRRFVKAIKWFFKMLEWMYDSA